MTGENRRQRAANAKNNPIPPELDFSPPPLVPPVEVVRPSADATDLDRWATERISIYASLDAAMTQHIVEAIRALSELKQRAEDEARQASQQIIAERDKVNHAVEELRQEQRNLEGLLGETRQAYDEEKTRLAILQQNSETWIDQTQIERDELQAELRKLRAMTEEANRELKELYQRRSDLLEESGGFAAWLDRQKIANRPVQTNPATSQAAERSAEAAYTPPEPKIPGRTEDFGDSPTPRIPGGSPVVWMSPEKRASLAANRRMTDEKLAALLMETDPDTPNSLRAIDIFEEISNQDAALAQALEPAAFPPDPSTTDNNPELAAIFKSGNTSREQNRRSRTEQRINQILNRTRSASDTSEEAEAANSLAVPAKKPAEPTTTEFLRELGRQLGLDPATPPSTSGFSFAPGYTPPPAHKPLRELLGDVTENANAINSSAAAPVQPIMPLPFEETSPEADDLDITNLLRDDDWGDKTLDELVADAEEEAAGLTENPTPPEEQAPFIGELGDNAGKFETGAKTPQFSFSPDDSLRPVSLPLDSTTPPPPFPTPIATRQVRKPTGGLIFPGFPIKPPELGSPPRSDMSGTLQTRLTISNLQGRYSPLMMEKVVRGLIDVLHVIVTDFSKGVLVMDVRHEAHLDLQQKLLSMPELRLRLVDGTGEGLEFMQEDAQEISRPPQF